MSRVALLTAAELAAENTLIPSGARELIKALAEEVRQQASEADRLQQELAENVAAEFAKQRVAHYQERAFKAEAQLTKEHTP